MRLLAGIFVVAAMTVAAAPGRALDAPRGGAPRPTAERVRVPGLRGAALRDLAASRKGVPGVPLSHRLSAGELAAAKQAALHRQLQLQHESRVYTALSNLMKSKHDTAKSSIGNVR